MDKFVVGRANKCDYYIGRPSPLGNPFKMRKEEDRDKVCNKYERFFQLMLNNEDSDITNELKKVYALGKDKDRVILGCYCSPRRCHGDTIANFLNKYGESLEGSMYHDDDSGVIESDIPKDEVKK